MLDEIKEILDEALQLGDQLQDIDESSQLIGSIPEFDSMTVVTVLTLVEERFGITIEDDEITAETFETVGSLVQFVTSKT